MLLYAHLLLLCELVKVFKAQVNMTKLLCLSTVVKNVQNFFWQQPSYARSGYYAKLLSLLPNFYRTCQSPVYIECSVRVLSNHGLIDISKLHSHWMCTCCWSNVVADGWIINMLPVCGVHPLQLRDKSDWHVCQVIGSGLSMFELVSLSPCSLIMLTPILLPNGGFSCMKRHCRY